MGQAVAASLLIAVVAVAGPAAAACPPAATLTGAPDLVDEVRALLVTRGIEAEPGPGCPRVLAILVRSDDGLEVTVQASGHRSEVRRMREMSTAAALIESWARGDLEGPLLSGEGITRRPLAPEPEGARPLSPTPAPAPAAFSVHGAVYALRGGDGSFWLEPEVGGCFAIGAVCAGAAVRGRFDPGLTGQSLAHDTRRLGVDVLVGADVSIPLGGLELRPGIGAGAGWLRSSFVGEEAQGNVDIDGGGLRLEARLGLGVSLSDDVGLELRLRAQLAPLARALVYDEQGLALAGEPSWGVGAGLGLRLGAP
ncbi:MAG: hypothetical protein KC621_04060 [Myxococcales bacterium]|nr:hypothetical protein [Myxococcales bacterium]